MTDATVSAWPLAALLQLAPLAGALLVYAVRRFGFALRLGQAVALCELLLAIGLYLDFDARAAGMQFVETLPLAGPFAYHAGADGVTVLFVLLAALITFLVALYLGPRGLADPVPLLLVVLAIEVVLMSMLLTLNLLWFVAASALELGLVGYLLWRWAGSPLKDLAFARFVQFQAAGLLMVLAGTLLLGWSHADATGRWSFDRMDLMAVPAPAAVRSLIFFLLFYGLGVRTPIFPLHGWLPVVMQHGNVAIGPAYLLGVKVGIYGMVRFMFPLLPEAAAQWSLHAMVFAAAGVFYAAALAFQQGNLRRMMAFAVVSHTGLIVMGLFTLHAAALQGAVLLAATFGLAATALLFIIGLVYRRTQTTQLARLGGLFDRLPFFGLAFLAAGFAIAGMPGTPGFDAVHLVLESSIRRFGALATVGTALGNVLAAGFLLFAFQRAFLAPAPASETGRSIPPATALELFIAAAVIAVLLVAGFFMSPWLDLVDAPMQALAQRLGVP